jgi:hypothetical protein
MSAQTVVMFPYSGYKSGDSKGDRRKDIFWKIIETCRKARATTGRPPIVILNRDTEISKKADEFLSDPRAEQGINEKDRYIIIRRTWSVDTCQMWLSGWGKVLDTDGVGDDDRIVQLPGDIEVAGDGQSGRYDAFFRNLGTFIALPDWDMVIGDFTSGDMFNAKELIDWYGTYALMANWFPEVAQEIRKLPLHKPRSEFLNIKVKTLKELLRYRKFAYEQTLNMLIRSFDFDSSKGNGYRWKYSLHVTELGMLKDDSTFRQYRDCLDQIERTERMLKLLWREFNDPKSQDPPQEFLYLYDRLDRRSTSIRENARIIIGNLLGYSSS